MSRIDEIEKLIGCTTINNTNNTNDTNNILTEKQLHGEQLVSATPRLGSSLSSGKSGVGRPAEEQPLIYGKWKWLKADLFSNEATSGKLHKKIAISLQKHGEEDVIRLKAAFNSPFRCFKRGVKDFDTNSHYQMAVARYDELRESRKNVWISKFYQNVGTTSGLHKPRTAKEMSGILYLNNSGWQLELLLWDMTMPIPLTDDISKFKSPRGMGEIIASRSINCGQGVAEPSGMINTRELLG